MLQSADLVGRGLREASNALFQLLQRAPGELPYSRYVEHGANAAFLVNVARSRSDRVITFEPAEWSLATWSQIDGLVFALDDTGRVIFFHQGNPELPRLRPGLVLGRNFADVNCDLPSSAEVSMRRIAAVMTGEAGYEHCNNALPDGNVQSINVRFLPWRYCGCVCGVIVLVTDVTHIAGTAIQEARAVVFRRVSVIQHELRNPLQTMQAAVEVLRPLTPAAGQRPLRLLNEQIQAVTDYLGDQLLVGLPAPQGAMSRGRLSQVVEREIERASLRAVTERLVFVHRPVAGEPMVLLRSESMGRAFANLFRNVAQARADARVEVTYAVEGGWLVCTVADDGPGFPPAVLSADWLLRSEPTQHLGLALGVSTLHAHGGRMLLSNREGGGACVELGLPIPDAPGNAQREAAAASEP